MQFEACTARYISHAGYLVLHSCRTRNTLRRMYLFQNRENPMIVRTKFISSGKSVAVTIALIFEHPGIPHSTVEQLDPNRKETVRRLIEQFENHPNRNVLLKDFEKKQIDMLSIPGYARKKNQSRGCWAWPIIASNNVPQSTRHAEEHQNHKERSVQNYS